MLGLGIESTAHTFSCAIIEKTGKKGKILSDVRKIYRPDEGEGIHPREASRHHIENSSLVLSDCLKEANISIKDLDIVSYAAGPGLGPCLRVGAVVARSLSSFYKIPIYPVNHAIGHIELGKLLTGATNPLVLLVSGGHTMLLAFLNKQWRVFGETLDITLGQLLDQFGRSIGFASPCGKNIEELANTSSNYVTLPYSVKGNDVSFSGLLSATKSVASKNKEDVVPTVKVTKRAGKRLQEKERKHVAEPGTQNVRLWNFISLRPWHYLAFILGLWSIWVSYRIFSGTGKKTAFTNK